RTCFMVRASDFPQNGKNQAAQAYRKYREAGGRSLQIPLRDWERMMTVREFHLHHRNDPGFAEWFAQAKLLSGLGPIGQILRLDLLGHELPIAAQRSTDRASMTANEPRPSLAVAAISPTPRASDDDRPPARAGAQTETPTATPAAATPGLSARGSDWSFTDWIGWGRDVTQPPRPLAPKPDLAVVSSSPTVPRIEDIETAVEGIVVGRELARQRQVGLPLSIMKRHAAVLGGSGSGKTTLALTIIEQLLLSGIPAVLIDRKGDLCSYANPDVWRDITNDTSERRSERERLGDAIDVAVYTPGRASGRPISITLLPSGINELPEHEQQLLANLSSAALGDMLHLRNSATHQKQSGTLSVALRILGARSSREVMLADLIDLLEEEDPELTELTQRMDPSGKLRRDLVAQLDSLRHRNAALFEGGGESLRMESLLGLGPYARTGRTRLSVIYTGFLGDNENILFWVAQFLSEALRFCQRNPNDELQAVVMFDEADLYIPANAKPATAEPLQSLLKRARSAGLGLMLATQSPGDLDYKSRDQITSWFIGRVREDTALRKLKAAFQSESGLDAAAVLPGQTVGEFHLVQEGHVRALKARRSLIQAEQVPFDRIETLASETRGQDEKQLPLFAARQLWS
ncbi:MAG: ATP-binding protein, partial [Hyphomicrobiaceae bacterium]